MLFLFVSILHFVLQQTRLFVPLRTTTPFTLKLLSIVISIYVAEPKNISFGQISFNINKILNKKDYTGLSGKSPLYVLDKIFKDATDNSFFKQL